MYEKSKKQKNRHIIFLPDTFGNSLGLGYTNCFALLSAGFQLIGTSGY